VAKSSGLGDNFYIGGYDLSGDVSSVDQVSGGPALIDVTGIKSYANERIGGLRDGDLQFTSFFSFAGTATAPSFPTTTTPVSNTYGVPVVVTISGGTVTNVSVNGSTAGTADGTYILPYLGTIAVTYTGSPTWTWATEGREHDILSTLPRTDTIASYFRGTTLLNPTFCVNGKQINYDGTRDNTGNLTAKVEVQGNAYGGEWGKQLTAGLRSDTTATTGAYADDNGAGSTFGAQAYLQLVELAGTSVDVKVRHCTTSSGTYADLIDFGSLAAVGAVRGTVSGTVNRYLEVVTSGTFTLATFAVAFVRNQAAVTF
jgi:hypothetical protein